MTTTKDDGTIWFNEDFGVAVAAVAGTTADGGEVRGLRLIVFVRDSADGMVTEFPTAPFGADAALRLAEFLLLGAAALDPALVSALLASKRAENHAMVALLEAPPSSVQ